MINRALLLSILAKKNMSFHDLAESIGISPQTMSYKVKGKRDFTTSEIRAIQNVLELTSEERNKIFFDSCVEEISTNFGRSI